MEPKKLDIDVFLAKLLLGGSGFWQAEPWGLFGALQVVGYREDLKRGVYIELKRGVYRVEDSSMKRGVYIEGRMRKKMWAKKQPADPQVRFVSEQESTADSNHFRVGMEKIKLGSLLD